MTDLTFEQHIGMSVARIRIARALSQQDIADFMRAWGHVWLQSTVSRVECGERKLSLEEGLNLATVLKVSIEDLAWIHDTAKA